jgi:phage/plasmid-like protein (TIGR03299 family)
MTQVLEAEPTTEAPDAYAAKLGHDQTFTVREVPWMKLGKIVDEPVTAHDAAELGGINFTVTEHPIYFSTKEEGKPPRFTKIDGRKAIVRNDTGVWLSVVSQTYPVLQYGEAFDFMDGLSPHFVAAGSLRGGKQGFMVVRAPEDIKIDPFGAEDPHTLFATLRTSHDCSRAVEVMVMPLRGRCMNQLTLTSFRKDVKHRWVVTHTGDVKSKLAAAHDSVDRMRAYATAYVDNAQRLAEIKITDENAWSILKRVLPDRPRRNDAIEKMITNWHTRTDSVGFDGNGWGLVNAVSEYFEWDRVGGSAESRFVAALQGQTHRAINKVASHVLTRN